MVKEPVPFSGSASKEAERVHSSGAQVSLTYPLSKTRVPLLHCSVWQSQVEPQGTEEDLQAVTFEPLLTVVFQGVVQELLMPTVTLLLTVLLFPVQLRV